MAATTAVVAGTATAVSGAVSSKQQAKANEQAEAQQYEAQQQQAAMQQAAADAVAQQQAAAPAAAQPASGAMSPDVVAQLQQLADLKAQGVLSDEEFANAKAKLLG
ncbi:SHOCT domain-containing protein [Agromyces sp. Soil535]|uniref:SHOCT domain-containing protein n=1 Tax=Agromyces sp. Soil535 TaxID=1736390 RepID=UPI001F16010F|nr:SHOCT domain-containing protein [Agromyces sp. Soil535]